MHSTDVLRAATVFLHSALEDFLRSLSKMLTPTSINEQKLNAVPLPGLGGRAEKFFLGKLVAFRGKTVDEIIDTAISEHLDGISYNNVGEVKLCLRGLAIDPDNIPIDYGMLEEMIKRRHHIVHQADRNDSPGRGQHSTRSISITTVRDWRQNVELLVNEVVLALP